MDIEKIIESLRNSDRYIEAIFTEGSCYKFYLFLRTIYPHAEPYFTEDNEHVVTRVGDSFYDITGNVNGEQCYTPMSDDDIATAGEWSFSKHKMLSLGECLNCEEPILI